MKSSPSKIKKVINGIKKRLTDKSYICSITKSFSLYKSDPNPFYKSQIKLNIKNFFDIKPCYGIILYKKIENPFEFKTLYHITDKKNYESIMKYGLRNKKTKMIFLFFDKNINQKLILNNIVSDPVIFKVDVKELNANGISLFYDKSKPYVISTNEIPANLIHKC